jgi:hypothetical protein
MDSYRAEPFKTTQPNPLNKNLLVIPVNSEPLLVKCTHTGITVLKEGAIFKKRVAGSQSHTLTPHPYLVENSRLNNRGNLDEPDVVEKKQVRRIVGFDSDEVKDPLPREYRINKKLIRARVYGFLLGQAKPVLHSLTISFPPCVTEDIAHQALNTWLTVCRQSLHLREYLWVKETQPTTGTVHFHSLIPQYLNIVKANRAMAVILANMVRSGQLKWSIVSASKYNGVHLGKNKNTKRVTNFARGSEQRALSHYITKYVSKNDESYPHLAWHNSRGFSSVMTSVCLTEAEAKYLGIRGYLNMDKVHAGEYAIWIGWKDGPPAFYNNVLRQLNYQLLNKGPSIDGPPLFFLLN